MSTCTIAGCSVREASRFLGIDRHERDSLSSRGVKAEREESIMHIVTPPARSLPDHPRGLAEDHRLQRFELMRGRVEEPDQALFEAHERVCRLCAGRSISKVLSGPGAFVCLADACASADGAAGSEDVWQLGRPVRPTCSTRRI